MKSMSKTILLMSMLVMLICCVSAVSATDADNITVPDDTDVIELDDTVDSVEEVESEGIDDTVDGVNNQQNLRGTNINGDTNIGNYFDSTTGVLLSTAGNTLTFGGDFYKTSYNYSNFIINRAVTINANTTDAPTLHDMGFQLIANGITLNGLTFDINAPSGENCYAIDIENANNVDVILPVPLYVSPSVEMDYRNRHDSRDWDILMDYFRVQLPDEYEMAKEFFNENLYSPCNMLIARREVLNELCQWLFTIVFAVYKKIGDKDDTYQRRYPGFMSERLISYYFHNRRDRYKVIYANKNFLN